MPSDLERDLARIRLAAFDVDGVLTDGRFLQSSDGGDALQFHTRDGLGLRLLIEEGVIVALLTGRNSQAVLRRGRALGIPHVLLGVEDKAEILREVARAEAVQLQEILYLGDDLPDLPALGIAGIPAAVADAAPEVRARASLVTSRPGGKGAVREIAERILAAKGRWAAAVSRIAGDADS